MKEVYEKKTGLEDATHMFQLFALQFEQSSSSSVRSMVVLLRRQGGGGEVRLANKKSYL